MIDPNSRQRVVTIKRLLRGGKSKQQVAAYCYTRQCRQGRITSDQLLELCKAARQMKQVELQNLVLKLTSEPEWVED